MIYGNDSTQTSSIFDGELTLDKIYEAMNLLKDMPKRPFIAYSWAVPYDKVYQGKMIDDVIKFLHPRFDPEKEEGFLVSERWRSEIEKIGK